LQERYKRSLARLMLVNTARARQFEEGLNECDEDEATVRRVVDALERVIATPQLALQPSFRAPKSAETLLLALGFRSPGADGLFAYDGPKTPATLEELKIAVDALESFSKRTKTPTHVKPEPAVGQSGTTTVLLVVDGVAHRRRFSADDLLEDVTAWARTIARGGTLVATAPASGPLRDDDKRKTLQALGFWPGVTLKAHNDDEKATVAKTTKAHKPKPSDLFKAINRRFDDAPPTTGSKSSRLLRAPPATRLDAANEQQQRRSKQPPRPVAAPAPA